MANEITSQIAWTVNKNGKSRSVQPVAATTTMAGNGYQDTIQVIGFAAHEALVLGDVATPGFAHFRNGDATNYVEIGIVVSATFYPFIKLMPGQSCTCWLGTAAPYAKANIAAVNLDVMISDR